MNFEAASVKAAVDIVKVVGDYVRLKRIGATGRYLGLCPFHQEKTPSFNVNQTRQFYKCFGCGVGGDALKFVMEIEGLTFPETLKLLAERFGVVSTRRPGGGRSYPNRGEVADLSQRLADFHRGLVLSVERTLDALAPWCVLHEMDPRTLAAFHRRRFALQQATASDLAATFRAVHLSAPRAAIAAEQLGREDRSHAEQITCELVAVLAAAGERQEAA